MFQKWKSGLENWIKMTKTLKERLQQYGNIEYSRFNSETGDICVIINNCSKELVESDVEHTIKDLYFSKGFAQKRNDETEFSFQKNKWNANVTWCYDSENNSFFITSGIYEN